MRRVVAIGMLVVMCFGSIQAAPAPEKPPQKTLLQHLFSLRGFALAKRSERDLQHIS